MKIDKNTQRGGGQLNSSLTNLTKANSKNLFKPLIASSLALALGVSVASADCTPTSNPIFCNGSDTAVSDPNYASTTDASNNGITKSVQWQTIVQDSQTYYQLTNFNGNDTKVSNLLLFAGPGGSPTISYKNLKYEIGGLNGLTLKSNKGIMVDNGTGQLGISIWHNDASSAETFALDLTGVDSKSYAVYANMYIEGNHQNNVNNTFTGKFGGKGISGSVEISALGNINLTFTKTATIGGNITISGGTTTITGLNSFEHNIIGNTNTNTGTINFETKVEMTGNITRTGAIGNTAAGDLVVNFKKGSTLTGNIQTGTTSSGNDYSANKVFFDGADSAETVVLTGNIISYGTGPGNANNGPTTTNGNHVTFTKGSMRGNIIADGRMIRAGYNEVTFSQAGAQLTGNITAKASNIDNYRGYGSNKVTFSGGGNYNGTILAEALALDNGQNQIYGTNTLVFENGTSVLSGTIQANWYNGYDNARGKNDITMSGTSNTISATITAAGGINTIAITNGTSEISGNISVESGGTNSITFSGTGTYTYKVSGDLTSSSGSNTIAFTNPDVNSGQPSPDLVNGTFNGGITTSGGTNTISASGILTLNNGGAAEKTYKVTGGTTQITAKTLAVNNVTLSTTGGSNTITATELDAANFNSIQAKGGNNSITTTGAGDLTITNGIYTVVYADLEKGNTITLENGDLTIGKFDSNMTSGHGDSTGSSIYTFNGNNHNIITLNKDGAVLSLAGNITSGGGLDQKTKNDINFDGTSGVLKSSSGDSISASGNTNINVQALTIQNNSNGTGTLQTTGGTTTITFKDGENGSLNGNISTTGGSTNLVLVNEQSYSFTGTFSTSNGGKNNIDLSSKSVTITTDLNFSGSNVSGDGGNIINIGAGKTLTLNNSGAKTISTSGGATYLNFNGSTGTIDGAISTTGGTTTINVADGKSGTITGSITTEESSATTAVAFGSGSNAKTLTLQGASNTLTSIDANNAGSLILGATSGGSDTTISQAIKGTGLSVTLNGADTKATTLTLNNATNGTNTTSTINTLTLGANSISGTTAYNTLALTSGTTTIANGLSVGSNQGINFDFNGATTELNLANLSNTAGVVALNFIQGSGTFDGAISTKGSGTTTIYVGTLSNTPTVSRASGTISGTITGNVENGEVVFGNDEVSKTLTLQGDDNTISAITLDTNSVSNGTALNTLEITNGTTTITTLNALTANQGINFDFNGADTTTLSMGSDGSGTLTNTAGVVALNFNQGSGTFDGAISTTGGTTTIYVGTLSNTPTVSRASGTISGTITGNVENGKVVFGNDEGSKTLTLQGNSNQLTLIDASNTGSLILDTTNNAVTTTISQAIKGSGLSVTLNGADSKSATLTLNNADNGVATVGTTSTIDTLTLGANSAAKANEATNAYNTLALTGGTTIIKNLADIGEKQGINFEVNKDSKLTFENGLNNNGGVLNIKGEGETGNISQTILSSNITTSNGTTNLYFKDALWIPASIFTQDQEITSGKAVVGGGISNLAVELSSVSGLNQTAIYDVVTTGGVSNILVKGTTDIGANVTYGKNGETNLMFVSGSNGDADFTADTDITTPENGISMFGIKFTDGVMLTLQDKDVATKNGNQSFLTLAGKDSSAPAFSFTTQRDTDTNTDTVKLDGVAVGKIQAIGSENTQDPSASQTHTYDVVLNENAIFAGTVALYGENQVINLTMEDSSKLFANNSALHIENLNINSSEDELDTSNMLGNSFTQKNIVIDLATDGNSFENISRDVTKDGYRVLVIGSKTDAGDQSYAATTTGLTGKNGLFRVYVDTATKGELGKGVSGMETAFNNANAYADRILVNNGEAGTHYIQAIYKQGTDLNAISYKGNGVETNGNIAVATVEKNTGIIFKGASQIQGFDVIGTHLTEGITTNSQGEFEANGAYETFFIKSATTDGIANSAIQTTSSALGINYDLFLANFNSLNKRMGELRDNDHGQGAWARVFVGGLSTSYGLGTQSTYTTVQAGYDYAFGFEGANNYLGIALSYANALTDTKQTFDIDGVVSGIDKTSTNGVEIALYNAYVEDSGWFNDTIFKFSYMMSDVKVINQSDTYNTNNFGIVLSDEFGYRFKLGSEKEWYIDPQMEIGFGYFNQSDLKQVLGQATLTGIQDAIVSLRARVGANWAYDFKNFTQGKGINASVYLGTYYSYDYISGGEIDLVTDLGTKGKFKPYNSTGRFELNVGTNLEIQNNTRIYFDFEKSFGGTITTDYQVNLGVRYSFGESNGYTPLDPNKKEVAPLKISDEQKEEVESTQEDTENTNSEVKSETTTEQTNSTETTSEEQAQ